MKRTKKRHGIAMSLTGILFLSLLIFMTRGGLVKKVEDVLADVQRKTFNELVPDDVIRMAIRDIFRNERFYSQRVNSSVRHAVFETYLKPAFESDEQYHDALSAAYGGRKNAFKKAGLPPELGKPLDEFRAFVMRLARKHLSDPENLRSFYRAKKQLILSELTKYPNRWKVKPWLEEARSGLEIFDDNLFQRSFVAYSAARDAWHAASYRKYDLGDAAEEAMGTLLKGLPEDDPFREGIQRHFSMSPRRRLPIEIPKGREQRFAAYVQAIRVYDEAERNDLGVYKIMDSLETAMDAKTPDSYMSLFAGRRHREGGQALVDAYIAAAEDLLKAL